MSEGALSAAMWWLDRGVGVVPLRPELVSNAKGKLSPIPWVRWHQDGPLRTPGEVREFWDQHPEAQLAIFLERGLVAIDVDLKHLPDGRPPEGFPIPDGFTWCYAETTKGGGLHHIFRVKEGLKQGRSSRVTGLAGYVDVLHGGILVVAPSYFTNVDRGYDLLRSTLPTFPTMPRALAMFAPWLAGEWTRQWERSSAAPSGEGGRISRRKEVDSALTELPMDPAESKRAIAFIRSDREAGRFFSEGYRNRDGSVDHSQTEFRLVALLRARGFSKSASWSVVRECPHAKSPFDPRGRRYFECHVWGRLERGRVDGQAA